jgi:hypothetical protein
MNTIHTIHTKKHKKLEQKLNRFPKSCFTDLFYVLCTLIIAIIMIVIVIIMIITQYSKFQFKICFNKIIGFIKKSTPLNTRFAAKTYLAVREFLLVAKNGQWFLKLLKVSKRDGQHLRPQ